MNLFKAISLKLVSALLFAFLSAFIRYLGETGVPVGQSCFSAAPSRSSRWC